LRPLNIFAAWHVPFLVQVTRVNALRIADGAESERIRGKMAVENAAA